MFVDHRFDQNVSNQTQKSYCLVYHVLCIRTPLCPILPIYLIFVPLSKILKETLVYVSCVRTYMTGFNKLKLALTHKMSRDTLHHYSIAIRVHTYVS